LSFSKDELEEMAQQFADAAALRDLNHTVGWEVYCRIARKRIDQQTDHYLRENFKQDEAWEARTELRAIKQFQNAMEDMVRTAQRFVDESAIKELIYSSQDLDNAGDPG
jgi:predicted nucleotide-binding protein (sugar kinase/HSP70/actin superfamily)